MEIKKRNILIALGIFLVGIIIFFYILINKNLAEIIVSLVTLIFILKLAKEKKQKILLSIPLIFLIIFSFLSFYEEIKNQPNFDITIHSFNVIESSTAINGTDFQNVIVNLATSSNLYHLYFSKKIKEDVLGKGEFEIIGGMYPKCLECTWYQLTIRKKGTFDAPLFIDLYSKGNVSIYNKPAGVNFECGRGIFSQNQCLIKIDKLDGLLKLVFYSNVGDLIFSLSNKDISYTETVYNSEFRIFNEQEKDNNVLVCGKKVEFPPFNQECTMYMLDSNKKRICRIWKMYYVVI